MAGKRVRKKLVYQKKSQNRLSMILSITVVAVIALAVSIRGAALRRKLSEYQQNKEQLEEQIAEEEKRSGQIDDYADYVQTDQYVEEVAHDKLGLVKDGEIIFRKDGSSGGTRQTLQAEDSSVSGTEASASDSVADAEGDNSDQIQKSQ